MQNQIATAAGLGMLLALDRRTGRRRRRMRLLAVSLASFSLGLAFAAGAAVRIVVERGHGRGLRRLPSSPAPARALRGLVRLGAASTTGQRCAYSLGSLASGVFDQLNAGLAGITGLFRVTGRRASATRWASTSRGPRRSSSCSPPRSPWRVARGPRLSPAAWAASGRSAPTWSSSPSACDELRSPTPAVTPTCSPCCCWSPAPSCSPGSRSRGSGSTRRRLGSPFTLANVAEIRTAGKYFEQESKYNRAELAALELARPVVDPGFIPESGPASACFPTRTSASPRGQYFEMVDRFGSPAYSPDEILAEPAVRPDRAPTGARAGAAGSRSARRGKGEPAPAVLLAPPQVCRRRRREGFVVPQRPPATRMARGTWRV